MEFERPGIIRPPSEHASYFLPLTSGCSNNTCTFCGYYGSKLRMREVDDIKKEIDAMVLYVQHASTSQPFRILYMLCCKAGSRGECFFRTAMLWFTPSPN